MLKKIFQIVLIVFSLTVNATDYYISSSNGIDTNNGLTETTPWQTLTKLYIKYIPILICIYDLFIVIMVLIYIYIHTHY